MILFLNSLQKYAFRFFLLFLHGYRPVCVGFAVGILAIEDFTTELFKNVFRSEKNVPLKICVS